MEWVLSLYIVIIPLNVKWFKRFKLNHKLLGWFCEYLYEAVYHWWYQYTGEVLAEYWRTTAEDGGWNRTIITRAEMLLFSYIIVQT